ncbi:MAG: YrdB family protein [Thermomicrobiales bacterium]
MTEREPPKQSAILLAVRFVMEVVAWSGLFWWGWSIADGGISGIVLGTLFFGLSIFVWGMFAVPDDPSRNSDPPIGIPGWLRLIIELTTFGLAAYGIWVSGARWLSEALLTFVGITYLLTYDRAIWLLQQRTFRGLRKKATS